MPEIHSTAQAVQDALVKAVAEGACRRYEGPYLENLRSVLAQSLYQQHVRLCCSGTFGVELAIRSLRLASEDEVLLAGYDFPGNLRAIQDAGVTARLCDVAPDTWIPTVSQLEQAVGQKTKALIVSHLHGALAPMSSICDWANQRGIVVVEDACQAHGATIDGKPAGSWGHLGVLSFGGSKLIAAGRGGAVVTNHAQFAQRMTVFCERGNDAFALSELQAAAILPQYQYLSRDHAQRSKATRDLITMLSQFEWLHIARISQVEQSAFYKLGFILRDSLLHSPRVQRFVSETSEKASEVTMTSVRPWVLQWLNARNIEIGVGFRGFVHRSASRCRRTVPLDNSKIASQATLVLHHSHLMDPETGRSSVDQVVAAFKTIDQEIAT